MTATLTELKTKIKEVRMRIQRLRMLEASPPPKRHLRDMKRKNGRVKAGALRRYSFTRSSRSIF
jgi:hypothetical protein